MLALIIALCILFTPRAEDNISIENYSIIHETKFGGVYIQIDINDFNELGFNYGDSVDVKFSNGYELLNLPYYNGYYSDIGEPLLIAYPGYDYIKVGVNYGADLWITAGLAEDDTATISLDKRGEYLKIQKSRDIQYSDVQGSMRDETFANFRNVEVGNIKNGILYRSASPVDNTHNRAPIVDKLIQSVGVKYIVNLSDSETDLIEHINKSDFDSPYFLSLYNNGNVLPLSMDAQFKGDSFIESLVKALTSMSNNAGPYLIHCVEGKDRTGYIVMIIEALLGASYEEIIDDYMITYDNYYDITPITDSERYNTIKEKNIDLMLHYVIGDEEEKQDLAKISDYSAYVRVYLLSIGMDEEAFNRLIQNLSK